MILFHSSQIYPDTDENSCSLNTTSSKSLLCETLHSSLPTEQSLDVSVDTENISQLNSILHKLMAHNFVPKTLDQ